LKGLFESDPELRRVALRTPQGFLAFGFGSGLSRYAPGTAGTVAAVPVALLLAQVAGPLHWALLAVMFGSGVYLCGAASRMLGRHDPGGIVWDEIVGYCLVVAVLPPDWRWWLAAFLLFRLFDILKPWPIRRLDRSVGGGLGIMLDDAVAALFAAACLLVAQRLL